MFSGSQSFYPVLAKTISLKNSKFKFAITFDFHSKLNFALVLKAQGHSDLKKKLE